MYPDKAFESREYELPFSLEDVENASIKEGGLETLLKKMFPNSNGDLRNIQNNFSNYSLCEKRLYFSGETVANIYLIYGDSAYQAIEKTSQNISGITDKNEMEGYSTLLFLEANRYLDFSKDKRLAKKNYHPEMKEKIDNFIFNFDTYRNTEEYNELVSIYSKEPQEILKEF